jgi:hypothetical protein
MSAATPANPSMRRAAPVRAAPPMRTSVGFDADEPEFRLNLSDIPRMRETMDIDGLKPTLLSRLFDLVAPLRP